MTSDSVDDTSGIELLRRGIGRAGVVFGVVSMSAASVLHFAGWSEMSMRVFAVAFGVLLAMPVKNVLAVLAEEIRKRDWWFVFLAVAVLVELVVTVVDQFR